jgi:hypothetical protein
MHPMPHRDSSHASVMPTGPPPTISTGTNFMLRSTRSVGINRS